MMGRKTLSEIKAELGLSKAQANGKTSRPKPAGKHDAELAKILFKKLAELERELEKRRKPKARRRAKH